MKRMALIAALALLLGLVPALGEEETVLYNGIITRNFGTSYTNVYKEMDKDSAVLRSYNPGAKIQITAVYPNWVEVIQGRGVGYILRHRVDNCVPVDPVNTPPFGVETYAYYTIIARDTPVLASKNDDSQQLSLLTQGHHVALIGIEEGYGKLIYHRQYAYINTNLLEEILPVAGAPELGTEDTPIAVFTSFYSNNENRINNLRVGCLRMNRVMKPGDTLNFNGTVGPFTKGNGYMEAPVLIDGETKPGYGGGSCQISSTLFNTILQLPGITVVERHPHGSNGAPYLPHGVDASSGKLNFIIRNDYPFAIRIDSWVQDFALTMAIYKED